jgi:hypothetical protein
VGGRPLDTWRSASVAALLDRIYAAARGEDEAAKGRVRARAAEVGARLSQAQRYELYGDAPQCLCAPNATVVWTRHRHPPDLVPYILEVFDAAGFRALAYSDSPPFGIGVNQLTVPKVT